MPKIQLRYLPTFEVRKKVLFCPKSNLLSFKKANLTQVVDSERVEVN